MAYSHHSVLSTTTPIPTTPPHTTYHHHRPSRPLQPHPHSHSHLPRGVIPLYDPEIYELEMTQTQTHTYVWVAEQDFMRGQKRTMKTEDWVRDQRHLFNPKEGRPRRTGSTRRHQNWEEVMYVYEVDAEEWSRQDERAQRVAIERERARARISEEVKKIEAKYEQRRLAERREREEMKRRAVAEERAAWGRYESAWASLNSGTESVDFKSIPWPMVTAPKSVDDITQDAIVKFLFSPLHSQSLSHKERLKSALLRWHPDRFRRLLQRVSDGDKTVVEEGVGIVARCLNGLMEKEKSK